MSTRTDVRTSSVVDPAIAELEARRIEIVNGHRIDELADLLTEDYRHVHAVATIDDRDATIEGFRDIPRTLMRGPLAIRQYGDVAVIIGDQHNALRVPGADPIEFDIVVTQVARRVDGIWRFASFHGCVKPSSPPRATADDA